MKKTIETLTNEEISQLKSFLTAAVDNAAFKSAPLSRLLMFYLMLDGGLRVGELVGLKHSDILDGSSIKICLLIRKEISKTKTERTVPLTNDLKDYLLRYTSISPTHWGLTEHNWLFPGSPTTCPITTRQVERIIGHYGVKYIGRKIHPHILRHTFATRLMRTTPIRIVQELLGHKCLSSTQVYTHPNNQDLTKAIETLNAPKIQ